MSVGHTPGPWGLESATRGGLGSDLVITDRDGGYTIASCRSATGIPDVEEAEANARLIVAAPDLYGALAQAAKYLRGGAPVEMALDAIDAALAKAVSP